MAPGSYRVITALARILILVLVNVASQHVPPIQPISFVLPSPPALLGPLQSNTALKDAERVHVNQVKGPSSFVSYNGDLFASTVDNKIYNLASCPPRLIASFSPPGCKTPKTCGQLLSLKRDPQTGDLIALDTFRGLFRVNPVTGFTTQIYSTSTPVNGRRPVHLNDMVISPDGVILMSDSSDVYTYPNSIYICLDARPTGRIISFIPQSGFLSELLPRTFTFPNGLELTPEGDLLVAETGRAQIMKVSLSRTSWLQVTPFAINLPGLPDNIRYSGRGTYWVAMTYPRHSTLHNPMDAYSRNPGGRKDGAWWMSKKELEDMFANWAIVVELDAYGNAVGSLHDPTGTTLSSVTEVNEYDGVLNIGSHLVPYMTRIVLPPGTGSQLTVDSVIQVQRSRCVLPDSQVEAYRQSLQSRQTSQA